jgi:hypothetical protein
MQWDARGNFCREETPVPVFYHSYLLRLWSEEQAGSTEWHSQIDHIQSGRRWSFDTLDKLLDFLNRQTEDPPARAPPSK